MKHTQSDLKQLVADHLGVPVESVTRDKYFIDDFGADALDVVELFMDVEEAFDFCIPQREADRLATFGALYDYLKERNLIK